MTKQNCRQSANEQFKLVDHCINLINEKTSSTTFLDPTNVPKIELSFFSNKHKNQILAVTVSNRHVENSKFPEKWAEARKKEIDSLKQFDVYDVVDMQDIPNDHAEPIGSRWLYTLKDYPYDTYQPYNTEAEKNARFKARLIVQGMNEKVDDTYSPTPSPV